MDRRFDTRQLFDLPPTTDTAFDRNDGVPIAALDPAVAARFGDFIFEVFGRDDLGPEPDPNEPLSL